MYSQEQRKLAIETFIKFDYSIADTVAALGFPNRHTLSIWWNEYEATGKIPVGKDHRRKSMYTDEQARNAVKHYLEHGKSLARTMRALGYPKGRETLCGWIDELAPGERKKRGPNPKRDPVPIEKKIKVVAELEASGGTYGYRRVYARVNADAADGAAIGEWTVRSIMEEERPVARAAKKKRRYCSYEGEVSEAHPNLLRDERGKRHFRADNPNELWITDVTEFRIPAGKVCLSPIVDCFDGMPPSWSISTSPDAEMANASLLDACEWIGEGDRPKVHSDRGGHYRWPGWIKICKENGLVRSMSRKDAVPITRDARVSLEG